MISKLALVTDSNELDSISPFFEMGAYEALWLRERMTFSKIAKIFAKDPSALPSDFVPAGEAHDKARKVLEHLKRSGVHHFGIRINHAGDYPKKLRDARNPVEMLYYQGAWELTEMRGICVVGSRKASEEGRRRAARIARELVERGFAVVSGLAKGIDTAAHTSALQVGGRTIAVIGTPLGEIYPKENRDLQHTIANEHLLVSQVPVLKYNNDHFNQKRLYFPERNATMSALTEGTIIVEAADTSGSLTQARAALFQGRKLFILESCFQRSDITWPARFEAKGAVRVRKPSDIWDALN